MLLSFSSDKSKKSEPATSWSLMTSMCLSSMSNSSFFSCKNFITSARFHFLIFSTLGVVEVISLSFVDGAISVDSTPSIETIMSIKMSCFTKNIRNMPTLPVDGSLGKGDTISLGFSIPFEDVLILMSSLGAIFCRVSGITTNNARNSSTYLLEIFSFFSILVASLGKVLQGTTSLIDALSDLSHVSTDQM